MYKLDFTDLSMAGGSAGREDNQWGWYDYVRPLFSGKTVLDVGTGVSRIKERFKEALITTHEASEQCQADIHGDLGSVITGSFDAVTCFDVIEHVVDYGMLAWNMSRIAGKWVFVTTPGREVTKGRSKFHFYEFHPWEILNLFEATGMKMMHAWGQKWTGDGNL